MTYRPAEYWERTLAEQFDLRGTGEPGLSLAYNRACYALRRQVLDGALAGAGLDPRGKRVLDVGCGTGFWTAYYTGRGANYTGLDIAPTSIAKLRAAYPDARFVLADVGEAEIEGTYDLVNVFDVLYHVTDDARWESALTRLARAVASGGALLVTDLFSAPAGLAEHNKMRPLERYRAVLDASGARFELAPLVPTHVLLNRHLGFWRFLNRFPGLLLAMDRTLLALGARPGRGTNRLLVAKRLG
ncbi:MAG: class I SAM-dependent methyltransferase [Candidatus Eisenbacteria bacterium]|nr:class I SAM-dependent methyltransferase [Candidatus Eisenbacteria bacterium]